MSRRLRLWQSASFWLAIALLLTSTVYWPGLSGGWLFDDYTSIVENPGVQPADLSLASLVDAALSSTTSEFKRPLASLSFALNYRATGLDPYWMKLTNLVIHLLNGVLVFLLARALLLWCADADTRSIRSDANTAKAIGPGVLRVGFTAVLIAASWMLLPINLTDVLYVVQRMESMANVFVLLGLLGYVAGRRRMLRGGPGENRSHSDTRGLALCAVSLTLPTALGLLAKETAVMLPLYALLIEWALFRARRPAHARTVGKDSGLEAGAEKPDRRIGILFAVVLAIPTIIGMVWLLPRVLNPQSWASRDFTLRTRLLSEARVVLDYIHWALLPTTHGLKFYYDDFIISSGWLSPWTTLASMMGLLALIALTVWLRRRRPLAALGLALFFGAQLLTGTIFPLELVYEHRNYFASFGLLLALVPLLVGTGSTRFGADATPPADAQAPHITGSATPLPYALVRHVMLGALLALWTIQTAIGAYTWGSPVRLTRELAARSPESPRAQYDLGRSYSVYSNYETASPFTPLAYAALEKAAGLPESSILPEQALIYMNARMHVPAKDAWWDSLIAKLKKHPSTAQDQGALRALSVCAIEQRCDLPKDRMSEAFQAALAHPDPGAQLQARYGDYAWNVLEDKALGERMVAAAVHADPTESDYRVALVHMLVAQGRKEDAREALQPLESLNVGGRLNNVIRELRALCATP